MASLTKIAKVKSHASSVTDSKKQMEALLQKDQCEWKIKQYCEELELQEQL